MKHLYHGTSSFYVPVLCRQGLRKGTYLTDDEGVAWDYAYEATAMVLGKHPNTPDSHNKPVVVTVAVAARDLRPSSKHGQWRTVAESLREESAAVTATAVPGKCVVEVQE